MARWNERKRQRNIELHGLDFVGADAVWEGFTVTREDIHQSYGEPRWVTIGVLRGELVVLVHTDRDLAQASRQI